MFDHYYCKLSYRTENGIANATTKCNEDDKCAMISTLDCSDSESVYSLCEKYTELIPKSEACTLKKKGYEVTLNNLKRIHIFNYPKISQRYIRLFLLFIIVPATSSPSVNRLLSIGNN